MKLLAHILLWGMLPLVAAEKPRAMFGVVPEPVALADREGLQVRAMHPESPARAVGMQVGDVIFALNGKAVRTREEMRAILRELKPGDVMQVELMQQGSVRMLEVKLVERPRQKGGAASNPDAAVGGEGAPRTLAVAPAIRQAMREHRRAIAAQLAALPEGLEPMAVSDHLQAIRHLARDANPQGRGWMPGEAGEVTLLFKDSEGAIMLHGASNKLNLTLLDQQLKETHRFPLNTPEERAAVPQEVIVRLRGLR